MNSRYKQLVDKLGVEGARLEMSRISKLNRKPRGFATMDKAKLKQVSSRGGQSSHQKDEDRQSRSEILSLDKD